MSKNWLPWCTKKIKNNAKVDLEKDKSNGIFSRKKKEKTRDPLIHAGGVGSTENKPFHVVLVDLKKAAKWKLHCVEKPLTNNSDLKFVAISYRWGEVQETTVDTGVDYSATITSFHLDDFFDLCQMMTQEADLQLMDYVWVDALCVNQANHDQRKATIYHMSDIYQHASYILAVPDLHLRYLDTSSKNNRSIISGSLLYGKYIYHLLQGNIQKLSAYDQQFLDHVGVPKDNPQLRHLLTNYTEHFTTGLATCRKMNYGYHNNHYQKEALQHIYETSKISSSINSYDDDDDDDDNNEDDNDDTLAIISKLHTCDDVKLCPFKKLFHNNNNNNNNNSNIDDDQQWKQLIPERSQAIRRSVVLLMDLVVDWSSRAWVVSEFHIAKIKNPKMKYWFIQLRDVFQACDDDVDAPKSFLTFDFDDNDDDDLGCSRCDGDISTICHVTGQASHTSENLLYTFHSVMRQQLSQQTFLERMLKSKASRHEDRFHAILPSSEYKWILDNKTIVDKWANVTTLIAVKLELYKWMTTQHKLELFFLAGSDADYMCQILPSFATSNISWPAGPDGEYPSLMAMDDPIFPGNFDLSTPDTIQLVPYQATSYKLNLKPREYYRLLNKHLVDRYYYKDNYIFSKLLALNLLDDNDPDPKHYDFIVIPSASKKATTNYSLLDRPSKKETHVIELRIVLIGCMATNKWVLTHFNIHAKSRFSRMVLYKEGKEDWQFCQCNKKSPGFDIY